MFSQLMCKHRHPLKSIHTLLYIATLLLSVIASPPQTSDQRPLHPAIVPLPPADPLTPLLSALSVLQTSYYELWQGLWPTSIDWTAAVLGTYIAGTLSTLATLPHSFANSNLINLYYTQLTSFYFGQDAFALRQEAYDDMLWVVLQYIETINFANGMADAHYNGTWYGTQYIPAFAHRARIFWELAAKGWDTRLCRGGMVWSPYLTPYKNAITNELYISASISMFLHFPGDDNSSPFYNTPNLLPTPAHDAKYLAAAVEAYRWLKSANMTDAKGLYIDGFHVSNWSHDLPANSTKPLDCDERNEMIYSYNQGVVLTGQRGLYEATGIWVYLSDGHKLVSDVIAATGWDLSTQGVLVDPDVDGQTASAIGKWHGLGRGGIMEEACDAESRCSQDSQTFKGIFFHHLVAFCAPLPLRPFFASIVERDQSGYEVERKLHGKLCRSYAGWVRHNAAAALRTRDMRGKFGAWWGAGQGEEKIEVSQRAVDYRNEGVPEAWLCKDCQNATVTEKFAHIIRVEGDEVPRKSDLNDRGRGRTVETQGGGVAILRAAYEASRWGAE